MKSSTVKHMKTSSQLTEKAILDPRLPARLYRGPLIGNVKASDSDHLSQRRNGNALTS